MWLFRVFFYPILVVRMCDFKETVLMTYRLHPFSVRYHQTSRRKKVMESTMNMSRGTSLPFIMYLHLMHHLHTHHLQLTLLQVHPLLLQTLMFICCPENFSRLHDTVPLPSQSRYFICLALYAPFH